MDFRPRRTHAGGFIDMTPVVDTIFNLLIFFALSMNFLANPGITVDLPDASAPQVEREDGDIRILVTPEGEVRVDGERVALPALGAKLRETARQRTAEHRTTTGQRGMAGQHGTDGQRGTGGQHRDPQVLIRADRRVPHGVVVEVMEAARSAGLTRLAIMTQRESGRK